MFLHDGYFSQLMSRHSDSTVLTKTVLMELVMKYFPFSFERQELCWKWAVDQNQLAKEQSETAIHRYWVHTLILTPPQLADIIPYNPYMFKHNRCFFSTECHCPPPLLSSHGTGMSMGVASLVFGNHSLERRRMTLRRTQIPVRIKSTPIRFLFQYFFHWAGEKMDGPAGKESHN